MITIIFDTNIYDQLAKDNETVAIINTLIQSGVIEVLKPRQVAEELSERPDPLPDLMPTRAIGHSVGRAGIMRAGDFLGNGAVYDAHKGTSKKSDDASIVDVASWIADWFVTEDNRCFSRFPSGVRCVPYRFQRFCEQLIMLQEKVAKSERTNQS